MDALWFALLAFMFTVFIVLDGWDIGAGALHLIVAKTDRERREVIAAIGPLWTWNEVWLVAAGGVFLLAFPGVMTTAFSGFYLALWMLLWSLILRGISIEMGAQLRDALWRTWWDTVFAVSNVLLAVLLGGAAGNVVRGVPLDDSRSFSLPLFTNFRVGPQPGLLDWYTMSCALFAAVLLAAHGATFLRLKTTDSVHDRSARLAMRLWIAAAALFPLVTLETAIVRPEFVAAMFTRPASWLALAIVLAGAWFVWSGLRGDGEQRAMIGSGVVVAGLIAVAAAALFPVMLPSTLGVERSMTAYDGGATLHGLSIALVWWSLAVALALTYLVVIAHAYSGKVRLAADRQGTR